MNSPDKALTLAQAALKLSKHHNNETVKKVRENIATLRTRIPLIPNPLHAGGLKAIQFTRTRAGQPKGLDETVLKGIDEPGTPPAAVCTGDGAHRILEEWAAEIGEIIGTQPGGDVYQYLLEVTPALFWHPGVDTETFISELATLRKRVDWLTGFNPRRVGTCDCGGGVIKPQDGGRAKCEQCGIDPLARLTDPTECRQVKVAVTLTEAAELTGTLRVTLVKRVRDRHLIPVISTRPKHYWLNELA